MFSSLLFALPFLSLAHAQSDETALQIAAIKTHFSNAGLVPDLLTTFEPSALLDISFDGIGPIAPGKLLPQSQAQPTPVVTITPANSSVQAGGTYTLALVDAGPVGSDQSQGQTRHWLVNGVTVDASSTPPQDVSTAGGTAITEYAGPAPPPGSGAHRYVFLLYAQPSTFTAPEALSEPNIGVSVFVLSDYVRSSGLGDLIAANYMTVEEGTATFTPSETSPVVTSTLVNDRSSSVSQTSTTTSASGTSTSVNAAAATLDMNPIAAGICALLFGIVM